MRGLFLSTCVIAIMAGSSPALAQENSESGEAEGTTGLNTIVVTAQFREESLQDAGLAIDVIDASSLAQDGINSGIGLAEASPGLSIVPDGGTSVNVFVRGVGNRTIGSDTDQSVIFNYDGVALARGGSAFNSLYDLERVEVLKGPQGTLYGRNTTGGVINIIPVKPRIGETGGFVNASYGNYNAVELSGAINAPLGDVAAVRVSGNWVDRDGYLNDGSYDEERRGIRGQILFEPSNTFSVRLAADYGEVGGTGPSTAPYAVYTNNGPGDYTATLVGSAIDDGLMSPATGAFRSGVLVGPGFFFQGPITDDLFINADTLTVLAEINVDFDIGTLTVIPAYSQRETDVQLAADGFKLIRQGNETEQRSIEARFAGSTGMVDFIVGGHYIDEDIETNTTINLDSVVPIQMPRYQNEAWSLFTELTLNFSESTRLVVGGRYTEDTKDFQTENSVVVLSCGNFPVLTTPPDSFAPPFQCQIPGNLPVLPTLDSADEYVDFLTAGNWINPAIFIPLGPVTRVYPLLNGRGNVLVDPSSAQNSVSSSEPTYKISLEQDVLDDTLLYATYARGYRAGGFDGTANSYEPEFLDAFTIGMKSRFLDNTLQVNAELFYWDYTDQQISFNTVNAVGAAEGQTQNVGSATMKGFEVDLSWLATDNTLVNLGVQFLDASYGDLHFIQPVGAGADNTNCPFIDTGMVTTGPTGGAPILDFDCSGLDAPFAPKWVLSAGLQQTFPLNNGLQIVASIDSTYTGSQQTGYFNRPVEVIDSFTKTNINLTLEPDDGEWFISAFVRNLENDHNIIAVANPLSNVSYRNVGIDRTYGVRAGINF